MTDSTIFRKRLKKIGSRLAIAAFWLGVWQVAYMAVAQEILLVSPVQAILRLAELAREGFFWSAVLRTCLRVFQAFLLAVLAGTLLAVVCARFRVVRDLLEPVMGIIRATPVASFIILALVWLSTDSIPAFSAFLMVLPMIWANMSAGIGAADTELLEMASVYRFTGVRRLRYIYLPAILPYFTAACTSGLGFAWKSAVAAEVIALPKAAVGRQIYNAKIYLETRDLFAWTIAVVLISVAIERLAVLLLGSVSRRLGGAKRLPEPGEERENGVAL